MAKDMSRKHGTGTFDRSTDTWKMRIKGRKPVTASIKKLRQLYGEVPSDERGSTPFWRRYLAEQQGRGDAELRRISQHQTRLRSLDTIISSLKTEGRDASEFEKEKRRVLGLPEWDCDTPDWPVAHPDAVGELAVLGLSDDPLAVGILSASKVKLVPLVMSLKSEMERYIGEHKAKGHHGWLEKKTFLDQFLEACGGDISLKEINLEHYRRFKELLKASRHKYKKDTPLSTTTMANRLEGLHTFLSELEPLHDIYFSFIRSKREDVFVRFGAGEKVQYTLEEVALALKNAKGMDRMSLLCGLNFGFLWGDMSELNEKEHFDGKRINKDRRKNRRKGKVNFIGSHLVWPETKAVLQYGISEYQLEKSFDKFREKFGLKIHKALRKTTSQWLQDNVSETAARLFRCENVGGTHGKSYIKFSDQQKEMLDVGLLAYRKFLFGG